MNLFYKQLKRFCPRLGVALVLLSFGMMTGLSPVLHAHELDLTHVQDDCAPCHWSQSNLSVDTDFQVSSAAFQFQFYFHTSSQFADQQPRNSILNRGPPLLS